MAIRRRSLLLCGTALVSSAATLWFLFVLLEPAPTPATAVSFDTLIADVKAGLGTEVSIRGREYTYRRVDTDRRLDRQDPFPQTPQLRATGPEPTLASVRALCLSTSTSGRCPSIDFEP